MRMSSSYDPQTVGQAGVINRLVEQYLWAFVHDKVCQWVHVLPWAEYHYKTSVHSGFGLFPYQIIFGKPPASLPSHVFYLSLWMPVNCNTALQDRDEILSMMRKNLLRALAAMKTATNKHHTEEDFAVNCWAYIKLQPYCQTPLRGTKYHKLSKRFYGLYLITEKVGHVPYKLALPSC